jgi:hypothetical protein
MTETATTITSPTTPIRLRFVAAAAAVAGTALVAIIAVSMSFQDPEIAAPREPAPAVVADAPGYAGDLHSEYLIRTSRNWGPVPMTLDQQRLLSDLHSEYLIELGPTFITPMTHEQARTRGELHSEYLRELALGW